MRSTRGKGKMIEVSSTEKKAKERTRSTAARLLRALRQPFLGVFVKFAKALFRCELELWKQLCEHTTSQEEFFSMGYRVNSSGFSKSTGRKFNSRGFTVLTNQKPSSLLMTQNLTLQPNPELLPQLTTLPAKELPFAAVRWDHLPQQSQFVPRARELLLKAAYCAIARLPKREPVSSRVRDDGQLFVFLRSPVVTSGLASPSRCFRLAKTND